MTGRWLGLWHEVRGAGVDAVADVLTCQGPAALELAQNSPFAGVISEEVCSGSWHLSFGAGAGSTGSPAESPPVAPVGLIVCGCRVNRAQLADILRAAARIVDDRNILVVGSQSVLATFDEEELPDAATAFMEVDLAYFDDPTEVKADVVDGAIGELSSFHEMNGVSARGVSVRTAVLPQGWCGRVVPTDLAVHSSEDLDWVAQELQIDHAND
jgi:hypothetical protein